MITLRDYQKDIVRTIIERKNVLIVAPMGAGKTVSTLTALTALVAKQEVRDILIVAPKRVAMSVWEQEAKKYDFPLNIRFCERASDMEKFLFAEASHRVMVCSVTRIQEIPHGFWDCVVIDESTLFKHKQSKRSKEIRRICSKVPYRIELSGTPIHNGYEGLWHQCFILDAGKALGKSLTEFRNRYCKEKYRVNGVVTIYDIDPIMLPCLMNDCKHLVYVVNNNAKLPPLLYKDVYIDFPKKEMNKYKAFEETNIMIFEHENGDNPYKEQKTLLAFCRTSLGAKLRQFASGFVYPEDSKSTWERVHTLKIDALKELMDSFEGGVLVAYQFQSELAELKNAFPKGRTLLTNADIEAWNRGDVPIAFVHPQSVGHGLNLQFGGHVLVWFSLTYDAELYAQLNKRLHRSGQTETVSVLHLISRGTIDEKVLKILQRKEQNADTFAKSM